MSFAGCVVASILIWLLKPMGALPRPGLNLVETQGGRTRRDIPCKIDHEYFSNGICCLSCPAGTHLTLSCTKPGEKGKCEECQDGTYTEHSNHLRLCLKCTKCRTDQEIVRPCTGTQNTECQCKQGGFCAPEQACEMCRKCSRCKIDEVKVRNCTATSNTECKKIQPPSKSSTGNVVIVSVVAVVLFIAGLLIVIVVVVKRKRDRRRDSQRHPSNVLKDEQMDALSSEEKRSRENKQPRHLRLNHYQQAVRSMSPACMEVEREELCNSLSSSASNSQHSLTNLPYTLAHYSLAAPPQRETELFQRLVPVNGEASLRSCFEYFEDLDVDYHKRFFRSLGIHDNTIKSKHSLQHEDRIHSLLNIWMEREGKAASLNDLLKTLLDLNQRLTADKVKDQAIAKGHYVYVSDREEREK
ncbi:hematopoietic death receptor isoform X1 [Thalassophryne amazonica]|uniref:hematopoietic death receptor isoform X1 n=1 Tax=Thalassophryne amazonica TaxID=390379 RepID=UPI001471B261|nr:hematopoietic death receptor isoform X1 [Thalassophryne amazonica]